MIPPWTKRCLVAGLAMMVLPFLIFALSHILPVLPPWKHQARTWLMVDNIPRTEFQKAFQQTASQHTRSATCRTFRQTYELDVYERDPQSAVDKANAIAATLAAQFNGPGQSKDLSAYRWKDPRDGKPTVRIWQKAEVIAYPASPYSEPLLASSFAIGVPGALAGFTLILFTLAFLLSGAADRRGRTRESKSAP